MRFYAQVVEFKGNHSERCKRKTNPEFSRMSEGGSTSDISISVMDFEMSSTENGMLNSNKKHTLKFKLYMICQNNI